MNLQIGSHIQRIRLIRGYPQKYVAKRLKISIAAYSKLEKREGNISIEYLVKIAEILNVSPSFIIEFDEEKLLTTVGYPQKAYIRNDRGEVLSGHNG